MKSNHLQQANEALRTIKRVNQAIQQFRHNRKRLLKEVGDILIEERGYETLWIGEFRHQDLYPSISCGNPTGHPRQLQTWITQAPFNQGAAQQAIEHKRAVVSKNRQLLKGTEAVFWVTLAVPVFINDEVTAILNACTYDETVFNDEEVQLLEELAIDIGFALESMDLDNRRQEAEDALRISEGRFRRLAENSMAGIILIQGDLIRYANPALAKMFGYTDPEAMIDKLSPLHLIQEKHRMSALEVLRSGLSGSLPYIQTTFKGLRQDHSTFDLEIYGTRTIHARRPAIIATVLDITEREQSRHQLESLSEAGLALSKVRTPQQALLKAVQQTLDIVPGDAVNIYLIENGMLKRVAEQGYESPSNGTMGKAWTDFKIIPTFQRMLNTRDPLLINDTAHSELWSPNPQRKTVRAYLGTPLVVRDEVIGFLNVDSWENERFAEWDAAHLQRFADYVAATIEHLRLVASLEAERQRLSLLNQLSQTLSETLELKEVAERALAQIGRALGTQQGLIYLWDEEDQKLSILSEQGINEENIKLLIEQLEGHRSGLVHWVVQHRQSARVSDVKQDIRWLAIPGANEWVTSVLDIPLEAQGQLVGVLSLLSTEPAAFTEHDKQLVEALSVPVALAMQNARYYQNAAHQAQVMAEALRRQEELDQMKDELIQNISHELRTPLALVLGYATMLQQGKLGPVVPEQAGAIDIITRRSRMLRTLVENITLMWQIETESEDTEEPELVDIVALANTIVKEFQNEVEKMGINMYAQTPGIPLLIEGIPLQLHRVLDNLIGNALKFTPEGGSVEIAVNPQGDYVQLTVTDSGIGIPQDKLGKIFERFYQVDGSSKRRYGGTGLGLALVKTIAEAHGGRTFAQSPVTEDAENPGTRIIVELPQHKASL